MVDLVDGVSLVAPILEGETMRVKVTARHEGQLLEQVSSHWEMPIVLLVQPKQKKEFQFNNQREIIVQWE